MKSVFFFFLLILSTTTLVAQTKQDSVIAVKTRIYMDSLTLGSFALFNAWIYENVTAKDYQEKFAPFRDAYLQAKYNEWISKHKK